MPQVLIIEDDEVIAQGMAGHLAASGFDPLWVNKGEPGLARLRYEQPDVCVLDLMLPGIDGWRLIETARAEGIGTPIVVVSARGTEHDRVHALEIGADDYLVKPFSARELLARVQTHLDLQRLRRRWAADLERANRELEAFSYSVSHDLRAPLRAIDGFASILLSRAERLDQESRGLLEHVRAGAARMGQIIDSLLQLSRVTRVPLTRVRFDLSAVARKLLAERREAEPQRGVEVAVGDGLIAEADPHLVATMLANLLGNAWKFTSRNPAARIEVGRELRDGESVYFVRDDGVGFDMQFAGRLFEPFRRLHAEAEFEGNGIGLATAQRVVHRHGGRIWAEASPGRGATFYFTLGERA